MGMFDKDNEFDPDRHTLEFFEKEWGITQDTLLYRRLASMSVENTCHALWAALYTCSECHNGHLGCQCWNDE